MKALQTLALGTLAAALLAGGAQANLIMNGGFETGDFTNWTVTNPPTDTFVATTFGPYSPMPVTGGNFIALSGSAVAPITISQAFSDTIGQLYTVDFWLEETGVGTPPWTSDFEIDGNTPTGGFLSSPTNLGSWTEFSFTFTGTGSDNIAFIFKNSPTFWALDNVSVTPTSVAGSPEPGTWALMLAGFAGLGAALRSRRKLATA